MKARIGLYSVGLKTYWGQFDGLENRITHYNSFIAAGIRKAGGEVYDFGLVDDVEKSRECGEYFNSNNVDIIFLHVATYATSATVVPVHKICGAKTVILNLQPCRRINYAKTTTGEWLAHCNACAVPEICNAFNRCGLEYETVNGLLGLTETPAISLTDEITADAPEAVAAWKEISEWIRAASAVRTLKYTRFGFLGNTYSGM
ncbi:MAG: arabinose isomerase, partial [Clostridia bacterium]|nr:arabinose isomerase [Clostridia bacterium]